MSMEKTFPDGQLVPESSPKDPDVNMPSAKTEMHDEEVPVQGSVATVEADSSAVPDRLMGMKLRGTTFAVSLSLFLSTLEISIVSTALVAITDDLKSFEQSSWIVTSYLLTYTGFLIIWAKFSDILGRRQCLSTALVVFIIASGACGAAQTTTQLIVFRAFQGIGGSGILSLTFVIIPEMVEPAKYALYAAITALTYAVSYLLGPLIGGAICDGTTWRWVFLLNLPAGLVALILLYMFMPASFPHSSVVKTASKHEMRDILVKIDYIGAILLFGASVCFVAALEEAGTHYEWSSATIIVLLALSALLAISFLWWEHSLNEERKTQEAVFTWRLLKHRVFMGSLAVTFLAGIPFTVAIIQIPQRFQTVSATSALQAGVRLLPFTLGSSVGTISGNILASKLQVPPIFILLGGAVLQVLSTALMSTLPTEPGAKIYGFEMLLSIGVGISIGTLIQFTPQLIRGKDQSVAMGAQTQFRALGGVIGLAIATNALNNYVKSRLSDSLTGEQLANLLRSVESVRILPADLQDIVRSTFAEGYDLQMRIMIGFGAAQILMLGTMWEKKLRRVA